MRASHFQRLGVLLILVALAGAFAGWARDAVLLATGGVGLLLLIGSAMAIDFSETRAEIRRLDGNLFGDAAPATFELDLPWNDPMHPGGEFCRVYLRVEKGHGTPSYVRVHAEWIGQCGDSRVCTDHEVRAALAELTIVDEDVLP